MAIVVVPVAVSEQSVLTRASVGWCWDVTGALVEKTVNEARYNWNPGNGTFEGALWEPARTNLFKNGAPPGTPMANPQTIAVAAGTAYTLSLQGSGYITVSGSTTVSGVTVTSRTLNGAGPTARVSLTFTANSTPLSFAVTGAVSNIQFEAGAFATSYIPTTTAIASRSADTFSGPGLFNTTFTDATQAYNAASTYALGDKVQHDLRIHESLDGGNLNHTPVSTADEYHPRITYQIGAVVQYRRQIYTSQINNNVGQQPDETPAAWKAWWLDVSANNAFAMFDQAQNVPSVGANGSQVFAFKTAADVNAVTLLGVQADWVHVAISNGAGGLATKSVQVAGGVALATGMNVPGGTAGGAVVSVYATKATGVVVIGQCVAGVQHDIGPTRRGLGYAIKDYSGREDDPDFGDSRFVRRGYSKQISFEVSIPTPSGGQDLNNIVGLLEYLRGTPTVWIGVDDARWARVAVVLGAYKGLRVVVAYTNHTLCAVDVDGLVQNSY